MTKEEQIEEMFNIIVDGVIDGEDNNGVPTGNTCANIVKALYEAGYTKQPTADVQEVRHGKWDEIRDTYYKLENGELVEV